jgi:IS30 family transposase
VDRLRAGWSPEQIAGRLRRDGSGSYVSHETIYAWVYSDEGRERRLARFLPYRRNKRRVRLGRKPRAAVFPESRSIHQRPDIVAGREQFGNWEADLMIFQRSHGTANVATVVERKTPSSRCTATRTDGRVGCWVDWRGCSDPCPRRRAARSPSTAGWSSWPGAI